MRKSEWFFNVGLSTIKKVIEEVCFVLCEVLPPLFLRFPTRKQFKVIANDFLVELNMPNCIGALDGRHCRIKKPPHSGTLFCFLKEKAW